MMNPSVKEVFDEDILATIYANHIPSIVYCFYGDDDLLRDDEEEYKNNIHEVYVDRHRCISLNYHRNINFTDIDTPIYSSDDIERPPRYLNHCAVMVDEGKKVGIIRFHSYPYKKYYGCEFVENTKETSSFLYNLWNGFAVETSDWDLLISYINKLIASGIEYDPTFLELLLKISKIAKKESNNNIKLEENAILISQTIFSKNIDFNYKIALTMHMVKLIPINRSIPCCQYHYDEIMKLVTR